MTEQVNLPVGWVANNQQPLFAAAMRSTLHVVSVPGEQAWSSAMNNHRAATSVPPAAHPASEMQTSAQKRPRESDDGGMDMDTGSNPTPAPVDGDAEVAKRVRSTEPASQPQAADPGQASLVGAPGLTFSGDYPLPSSQDFSSALVTLYAEDHGVKINDVAEFVGILIPAASIDASE
jgi:hypothetical protein